MSQRRPWKLWQALLLAATGFAILLMAPVVVCAVLVHLRHGPKGIEVLRFVTAPNPSLSAPTGARPLPSSNPAAAPMPQTPRGSAQE
ncbi:MAG TPA: hypothetical protein VER11_07360 [Polyangiaceae bacterium]|nr:hypothetical protein [Polyangiaceae bacterium]